MTALADVVAIGDVMLDVEVDALSPGERLHAPVRARAGGSAVNAALAASEAGASSAVVGCVGADAAGNAIVAELERRGVAARLSRVGSPTGIVVYVHAENAVVSERGANALLDAAELPRPLRTGAALVSGYTLLDSAAAATAALELAEAPWLAVDAGSEGLVEAVGRECFLDTVAKANCLFANEATGRALTDAAPDGAARRLGDRFRVAVITAGRGGAVACVEGRIVTAVPPRSGSRPRPGAGDALAGAMLAHLAQGAEPEAALRAAVDFASARL